MKLRLPVYASNSGDRPVIRGNRCHDNYACGIHMNGDLSLYQANSSPGGLLCGAADVANVDSDYNALDRVSPDGGPVVTLSQWQSQGHEPNSHSAAPAAL